MDPNTQNTPVTPASTASLDDILASLEQQTAPTPAAQPTQPITPPLANVPGSNEPPATPLTPEEAQNRTGTPFDLKEHPITTPGMPTPLPVKKADAPAAAVTEDPTFEKPAVSSVSSSDDAPKPKKKGFSARMALGVVVLVLTLVGGIAAFVLSRQEQDIRQRATGNEGQSGNCSTGRCTCNSTFCGENETCYVVRQHCDSNTAQNCTDRASFQDNGEASFGGATCGTVQIDMGCKRNGEATGYKTVGYTWKYFAESCGGSTSPSSEGTGGGGGSCVSDFCAGPEQCAAQLGVSGAQGPRPSGGNCTEGTQMCCIGGTSSGVGGGGGGAPQPTEPPTRVCGEECTDDAMCQRNQSYSKCQAVDGKKICVSTLCQDPKNTQPGANCFCQNEKGSCGQRCGTGIECQEGLTCGFINVPNGSDANSCDDFENTSGNVDKGYQYCIPEIRDADALDYTSDTKYRCTDGTRARRLGKWDETRKQWVFTGLTRSDITAACAATPAPSATPRAQRLALIVCKAIKRSGRYVSDWKTVPQATFALEVTKGPSFANSTWNYGATFDTVSFNTATEQPNFTLPGSIPALCKETQNIVYFGNYSFKAEAITAGNAADWKEAVYHDDYESVRTLFKYGNPQTSASFREIITLGIDSNDGASRTILVVNDTDKTVTVPSPTPTAAPSVTPSPIPTTNSCIKVEKLAAHACVEDVNQVNITLKVDGTSCTQEVVRKPLDVILVVDRSSSMANKGGTANSTISKLASMKAASKTLIDQLDPNIDKIGLVSFSSSARTDITLGEGTFANVKTKIDTFTANGGTNIGGALKIANDMMAAKHRRDIAEPVIVILTDGGPNYRTVSSACASTPTSTSACATDAVEKGALVRTNNYNLYGVGLFNSTDNTQNTVGRSVLTRTIDNEQRYFDVKEGENLTDVFKAVMDDVIDNSAKSVVVTDILPAGVTYVNGSAEPAPSTTEGQTLTWNLQDITAGQRIITLKANLSTREANQLVDVYPDSKVTYQTANGQPVSVPFPETRVSPEACVVAPACLNITRSVESPTLGSQVQFTCGTVAGATKYEFRYRVAGDPTIKTLEASSVPNVSVPLNVTQAKKYEVQCRPCKTVGQTTACAEFEPLSTEGIQN